MTYSVHTPFLRWFGGACSGASVVFALAAFGHWLAMFFVLSLFGGCGAALLFMSARITADDTGLTVQRLQNKASVTWSSITSARVGGGNLVLYTKKGRISLPSFEFWAGPEKLALINLMAAKFRAQQVSFGRSAGAIFHAADR